MSGVVNQPTDLRADTTCLIQLSAGYYVRLFLLAWSGKVGICFKATLCDSLCSDEWPTLEKFFSRENEVFF